MQQNITEEYKDTVYKQLSDMMIVGLQSGTMTVKESEDSAEFILDGMKKVVTQRELLQFLYELSTRWYDYTPVYNELHKTDLLSKVEEELQQITQQQT